MKEEILENIKEKVRGLIEKMGFKAEIEIKKEEADDQENIICNIAVEEDSHLLIGQYGVNLQALQHIARLLVRKEVEERVKFILDVNSYRQQKNQSVIEQAHQAASQAISEGRAIILRPMSAYERRIIHIELANNPEVVTESIGEGEGRKVVIKPAKAI
jgi:spoIIIJ-associated protein